MASPFLGEIKFFSGNFAPRGWALCNGQSLSIAANTALFSLLGTTYGGNGTTTFSLPNFQCCVPMHQGAGVGLGTYVMGETVGAPTTTLTPSNIPEHTHALLGTAAVGNLRDPDNAVLASPGRNHDVYANGGTAVAMAAAALPAFGSSSPSPITRLQPFLNLNFIIALEGIYPSRN